MTEVYNRTFFLAVVTLLFRTESFRELKLSDAGRYHEREWYMCVSTSTWPRVRRDHARCTIGSRYANGINLLTRGWHFVGHDPLSSFLSLALSPWYSRVAHCISYCVLARTLSSAKQVYRTIGEEEAATAWFNIVKQAVTPRRIPLRFSRVVGGPLPRCSLRSHRRRTAKLDSVTKQSSPYLFLSLFPISHLLPSPGHVPAATASMLCAFMRALGYEHRILYLPHMHI